MRQRSIFGRLECPGNDCGKASKGQDIDCVVMQNEYDAARLPLAQILEINIRDHLSRKVAFPLEAEDLVFQIDEAAAIESQLPKASGTAQQIEVLHAAEGRLHSSHSIACFEERLIVGL